MSPGIALDGVNGMVAGLQTAFGPFLAVHLGGHGWSQAEVGVALSISTVTVLITQLPAGALVDGARDPRQMTRLAMIAIGVALLLLAIWPIPALVFVAMAIQGAASSLMGPALAATSLALVGRAALGERLGRNARFASIGNGMTAAAIGLIGGVLAESTVMILVSLLAVPGLLALQAVRIDHDRRENGDAATQAATQAGWRDIATLLRNPHLTVFAVCVGAFQLSNAAMMPMAAAGLSRAGVANTDMIVAIAIVMPQIVVALCAPAIGRYAEARGRRPLLLLGWSSLPVQGLLLAVLPNAWLLPFIQLVGGIGSAVLGVMLPLIAADFTRGTRRFTLCLSTLNFPIAIGATLSTTLGGFVAERFGDMAAFLSLGLVGLGGTLLVWLAMPETRPAPSGPITAEAPAR